MKIKSVRIQNFRGFQDETVSLNYYSCFVGPNGSGKSTVLCALNVFFREQSSTTDVFKLDEEDYYQRNTNDPVKITVTFDELTDKAQTDLGAYYRNGELVVTAEATYDPASRMGHVKHHGQRLGMEQFRIFFDAEKTSASATSLSKIYEQIRQEFPDLPNPRSKDDKADALRSYEGARADECILIPSEDNFYGINSTGKLAPFVQWVYVPAVKDAGEEEHEAKNTALGRLITRAVRNKTNFDTEIESLRLETLEKYKGILHRNNEGLAEVSTALHRRLEAWAHADVRFGMEWISDPSKSVTVQQPFAGIKTGEGEFLGSLARMGHGLQRSYLLALLQELASSNSVDAPTLILACEEPELYQHPPQARHLASVFCKLASTSNQILVTTHSPYFVNGDGFENLRLVCKPDRSKGAVVRSISFENLCVRIRTALGEDISRQKDGLVAKIHQALQPAIAEMFFARVPVLVEGLEDVSYITTHLHLSDSWSDFRKLGCHMIPVSGKDKLIQPLALAIELKIPFFIVFDSDGDTKRADHRTKHERDNRAIMHLLKLECESFPSSHVCGKNHTIWSTNLTKAVRADFPNDKLCKFLNLTRRNYAHEGGLEKHDLFIADWLSTAYDDGHSSKVLTDLTSSIINFAREV